MKLRSSQPGLFSFRELWERLLPYRARIEDMQRQLDMLTSYSSDTVYRLRYDTMRYEYVSPAVIRLLGFTPEEMKHINFRSLILETRMIEDSIHHIYSFDALEEARKNGEVGRWQADYLLLTKDGRKIWVTDISSPWYNAEGQMIGSIGSLRDITDRVEAEEKVKAQIEKMAFTDSLTRLHNRRSFLTQIENELKRVQRHGRDFSVLLIDIDHFRKVNETHGHAIGDALLVSVADVIRSCLRETDVAARTAGGEFGVFLPDTSESGAYWTAEHICRGVAEHPLLLGAKGVEVACTVSIGIASSAQQHHITSCELYKQADTRLYIAKHTGRNQVSADEIMQLH